MAGLESYDRVYRGKPERSWESEKNFPCPPYIYHGQEVIRPLGIPVVHPLLEDSLPPSEGQFL